MKILLTGSNGYIGSHLYSNLIKFHTIVRGIRVGSKNEDSSAKVIDFKTGQGMQNACEDIDCVIHCAYDSVDQFSNITAIQHLLKVISKSRVKKLILFGTFATYDNSSSEGISEISKKSFWNFKYLSVKNKIESLISEYLSVVGPGLEVVYLQPTIVTDGQGGWETFRRNLQIFDQITIPYGGLGYFNSIDRDQLSNAVIRSMEIKNSYFSEARSGFIKCLISGSEVKRWKEWLVEDSKIDGSKISISNLNQLNESYCKDLFLSVYYGGASALVNTRTFGVKKFSFKNYYSSGLDRITMRCAGLVDIGYAKYLGVL
jgi:putative NADH-flavin reductase